MSSRRKKPPIDVDARLDEIYAAVPDAGCKGLCQSDCNSVRMTEFEQRRIAARHQVDLPLVMFPSKVVSPLGVKKDRCAALHDGRCTVYADRPLVCRLYSAAEGLGCEHGCEPEAGRLSRQDAAALIAAVQDLDGPGRRR